jgi:hypothetical protein
MAATKLRAELTTAVNKLESRGLLTIGGFALPDSGCGEDSSCEGFVGFIWCPEESREFSQVTQKSFRQIWCLCMAKDSECISVWQ